MQATTPLPPQEKVKGNSIAFVLDKPYYLPGDRVQGKVRVNLEHDTSFRSLSVFLQGIEEVRIVVRQGKSSATYKSSKDILNVGVELSPKATVQEGTTDFPFAFELPADALPSYSGKFAHVTWKLSTRADIPWGRDLHAELFLPIMKTQASAPSPVSAENNGAAPRIRLSLSSNLYQPGETVEGKLALVQPGNMRGVRLQLSIAEQSTGKGSWTGSRSVTETIPIGTPIGCSKDELSGAAEIPFKIPLSQYTSCSYVGTFSSITWYLWATLDIPHGTDFHFALPFTVALRPAQQAAEVPKAPAIAVGTPGPPPAPPVSQVVEEKDPEVIIVKILSDGSPQDIVSITSQLREQTGTFLDLNQVKEMCEKLVSEGKLERTGEGQFLAQYSMKW